MDINSLKCELRKLGALTTGPKKVLERRLAIWREKELNKCLYTTTKIEVDPVNFFPEARLFQPLIKFKGRKILNGASIDKWFDDRKSKKGKSKGRILALKLFIKYTQLHFMDNMCYVNSVCCAEQKKTAEYKMKMVISVNNNKFKICNCTCSCPAGTGWSAACKHLGALCYSLEYFTLTGKTQEYISCTSESVSWNKPKGGRGIEYMSIFDINQKMKTNFTVDEKYSEDIVDRLINHKINCPLVATRNVNLEDYQHDHNYAPENRQSQKRFPWFRNIINLDHIASSEIPATVEKCDAQLNNAAHNIEILDIIFTNAKNSTSLKELNLILPTQQCCKNIYDSLVPHDVLQTCINTKNDKKLWHKERQFRITGSRCYSIFTFQKDDWHVKSLKYFWPKSFLNRFMQYGLETEVEARTIYKDRLQYDVVETGLIISERHPWLAYSPDGIIIKNGKPNKLLEIKCPVIGKEVSAVHFVNKCDCLVLQNDRLCLKKKHSYYAQVQLGMAILNLQECDFILYSSFSKTFLNIIVHFDKEYVKELLNILQKKYFNNMLHVICSQK